ncbi:hypothetical protein ACE1SV_33480 [Streptomyces sennicomposti]
MDKEVPPGTYGTDGGAGRGGAVRLRDLPPGFRPDGGAPRGRRARAEILGRREGGGQPFDDVPRTAPRAPMADRGPPPHRTPAARPLGAVTHPAQGVRSLQRGTRTAMRSAPRGTPASSSRTTIES